MADAAARADELIRENAVMIFSKTWCPYCSHSKEILQAKQKEYEAKGTPFTLDVYELDQDKCKYLEPSFEPWQMYLHVLRTAAQGGAIQDYLAERSGSRTVPRIFVAGKPLSAKAEDDEKVPGKEGGGSSDLDESMKPKAKRPLDEYWLKEAVKHTAGHTT